MFPNSMRLVARFSAALVLIGAAWSLIEPAAGQEQKPNDAAPFTDLKANLKAQEDEIAKIRRAMLREISAEEKKVADLLQKTRDAQKAGDRAAFKHFGKLQSKKSQLMQLRMDVERRFQVKGAVDSNLPVEQRLGLQVSTPTPALRTQLSLDKDAGLIVTKVAADSAAAKVGLRPYDILLQIGDKKVSSDVYGFRKMLQAIKAGSAADVVVVRQGKQETIKGLTIPADVN